MFRNGSPRRSATGDLWNRLNGKEVRASRPLHTDAGFCPKADEEQICKACFVADPDFVHVPDRYRGFFVRAC